MRRREFIGLLSVAAISFPTAGEAQIARVGYLAPIPAGRNQIIDVFEQVLEQLGWKIGQSVRIEYRYTGGREDMVVPITEEALGLGVDVLVVWGPPLALAAKRATTKIPVVFLIFTDPVAWGLVSSYANSGGNITGITSFASTEIIPKYLEFLKEAVPLLSRVALLVSTERNMNSEIRKALTAAAKALSVELDEVEVAAPAELRSPRGGAKDRGAQGVFVWPTGFAFSFAKQISDAANTNGLPSIHPSREGALAGGLLAYGPDFKEQVRRGAVYVDKILKGAQPGSLPVEQLSKYELVINLKTAKALGLEVPPTLLARADEVIE